MPLADVTFQRSAPLNPPALRSGWTSPIAPTANRLITSGTAALMRTIVAAYSDRAPAEPSSGLKYRAQRSAKARAASAVVIPCAWWMVSVPV